jgi:hypothetical protein
MTSFFTQKKRENNPQSFSTWMRKNGTQIKNTLTPDKAATIKIKSAPTQGLAAEGLFGKGLSNSGYARFLGDEAKRSFQNAKKLYAEDSASALEKNLSGYARYLTSHEEGQASLRKQMIDRIGKGGSFNTETAYQIALSSGLTDENAKVAASLGVAAAKEKATSRLLEMILAERLKDYRAMEYAREMGFNEEEIEKFGAYAREINDVRAPSYFPDGFFTN